MCQSVSSKVKAIHSSVLVHMMYEKILFLKSNILFLIIFNQYMVISTCLF